MTDWSKMVSGLELDEAFKMRRTDFITVKVLNQDVHKYQIKGYEIYGNPNTRTTVLRKNKEFFDLFEDELWQVFYKMGFKILNKDNSFKIQLNGNSKQIDILAVDDETILVVECKASQKESMNLKQEIESITGIQSEIREVLTSQFQNPKRKIKHILAVKGFEIENADMERLKAKNIAYFNYDSVLYYRDLVNHLGPAAKYQLLGNLFQNTKIEGLDNKVLSIKGKMGDKSYYSFLIEPERLLKLAYILHRHKANISNFPTYQRLVKKERLKSIRNFVDEGGYFANSIICSIDGTERFEPSAQPLNSQISKVGVLHLPQTYMSMYIIDGQHRLYGYSESRFAANNVIPVVAFYNMLKKEQVKLFMDINENQKAVSKSLRNTLNVNLLWDSENLKERQEALMIKIAESLGEDKTSPLFGRVLTGEESKTDKRVITTEIIKSGIKDSNFLNRYSNNSIQTRGTFDKDDNDKTYEFLFDFLKKSLRIIKESNNDEWEKGSTGYLTTNNTVYALIKIIDDINRIKLKEEGVAIADSSIFEKCKPLIIKLGELMSNLSEETLKSFRQYGAGGKKTAWRALQLELNAKHPEFTDKEIIDYIETQSTANHDDALEIISKVEVVLKKDVKDRVQKAGNYAQIVGDKVLEKLLDAEKQHKLSRGSIDVEKDFDYWQVISFEEIIQIIKYGSNWSNFMQDLFDEYDLKYGKRETIDWLEAFATAKKKISSKQPITKSTFEKMQDIVRILEEIGH